ncbi:C39 family peptidase, partial [Verrucomicrobiales bacterium]|nr:C39 family peptidase [Verrucomicrobiales bacterium]
RMRMARRDAEGTYAAAMNARAGATVRLSDLPRNVKRDNEGNVFVKGVPMVDQGQKGYCVVASAQRLFEYYGIPCDQHQLAQIANADPDRGTSTLTINEELGQIDHLFKTRFEALAVGHRNGLVELVDNKFVGDEVEERDYHKMIHKYIDEGIPLLWSLGLGEYAEEPAISPQADGGHMRMIIGYNDKTQRIIFSDSWGAGHEFKTMDAHDSYKATHGLFLLKPTTR